MSVLFESGLTGKLSSPHNLEIAKWTSSLDGGSSSSFNGNIRKAPSAPGLLQVQLYWHLAPCNIFLIYYVCCI